jgi:hypothetical protein
LIQLLAINQSKNFDPTHSIPAALVQEFLTGLIKEHSEATFLGWFSPTVKADQASVLCSKRQPLSK